jgi:hypothetical protein
MTGRTFSVEVGNDAARITMGEEPTSWPLQPLPDPLLEWFIQGRKAGYESLYRGEGPGPLFSRHLPVVATTGEENPFCTRLAHKGVGFLPRPDMLDQYIEGHEKLLAQTKDLPPARSLQQRLERAARFLDNPGSVDPRLLGSLEIFAGGTYKNLKRRPLASLLFTDPGNGYRSFQLDCAVQLVEPPDPRFRFLQLARGLFERDPFHVTQPGVRCAYLFWIVGIHDKTPHPVDEGNVRHKL